MQNFIVSRCLVTEEIVEQIKSEPRTQNPEHTQAALYNKGFMRFITCIFLFDVI